MAPRQTRATRIKQQRQTQPKKSTATKEASRQARQHLITKRVTKTGSKVIFKL